MRSRNRSAMRRVVWRLFLLGGCFCLCLIGLAVSFAALCINSFECFLYPFGPQHQQSLYQLSTQSNELNTAYVGIRSLHLSSPRALAETSPLYTSVQLVTKNIIQRQPLHVVIQAKDVNNQSQLIGGDLFFAFLINKEKSYYQTGAVHDFDNGSYLVEFLPDWSGSATINIVLEYTSKFRRDTLADPNYGYFGSCTYLAGLKRSAYAGKRSPYMTSSLLRRKPVGRCYQDWKPLNEGEFSGSNWCTVSEPHYGFYSSCQLPHGGNFTCDDSWACYNDKRLQMTDDEKYRENKPNFTSSPITSISVPFIQPSTTSHG